MISQWTMNGWRAETAVILQYLWHNECSLFVSGDFISPQYIYNLFLYHFIMAAFLFIQKPLSAISSACYPTLMFYLQIIILLLYYYYIPIKNNFLYTIAWYHYEHIFMIISWMTKLWLHFFVTGLKFWTIFPPPNGISLIEWAPVIKWSFHHLMPTESGMVLRL